MALHWTVTAWWHHQMETFSALLAICAGNSPVTGEFPAQRPVTRGYDVFFNLRLNKQLTKQSWGWWFATPSCPLWRHCNEVVLLGTKPLHTSIMYCLLDHTYENRSEIRNKIRFSIKKRHLKCRQQNSRHFVSISTSWHLFCAKAQTQHFISMTSCKTAVSPLLTHWRYCSLALGHRFQPGYSSV